MKKLLALVFAFAIIFELTCQPALNVFKISGTDVDETTVKNVNETLYAFLAENKNYKVVDCLNFASPTAANVPSADFNFYGELSNAKNGLKLDLILKNTASGNVRLLTKNYSNVNLILLESKNLLQQLLDQNYKLDNENSSEKSAKSSEGLAGTWAGEDDLRSIKLTQNGRGIVIFKSGFSMSVEFVQKGNSVIITQKSNSNERQFPNLPATVVKEAVARANPVKWTFTINETVLSGTRTESVFEVKNDKVTSATEKITSVTWTKLD